MCPSHIQVSEHLDSENRLMPLLWKGHGGPNPTLALSKEDVVGLPRAAWSTAEVEKDLRWDGAPRPLWSPVSKWSSHPWGQDKEGPESQIQKLITNSGDINQEKSKRAATLSLQPMANASVPGSWFSSFYVKIPQFPRCNWPKWFISVCAQPRASYASPAMT